MRITYDAEADALYIELRRLAPGKAECRQLTDELTVDFGPDGRLAGLEILDASLVLGDELQRMVVEVSPVLSAKSA
jgi:uncharacterized protein YuzE